jgi:hypothetical protein
LQSADFLDASDQSRLAEFVAGGGQLIVGPAAPYLDAYLQPCETLSSAGGFRIVSEADLPSVIAEVAGEPEFRADDQRLEVVPHYNANRTLLFVSNPTPEPVTARILMNLRSRLTRVWPLARRMAESERISLHGYTVQVWEVERIP